MKYSLQAPFDPAFGRVPGDWKYDWQEFARECRKARWEGPQVLRIERA